jgi:tetratricopeptide (TPR) repeat protein
MSFPRLRTPRALVLGLILVGGPSSPALAADDFERYVAAARRLYENLSYERALDQIQRARRISRGVEQDVILGLYEGIILADLGRWGEAREAFFTALLLQPEATLPLNVAPKVEEEFEAQRVRARKELAQLQAPRVKPGAAPSGSEKAPPPVASTDRPEQARPGQLMPTESSPALTPTVEAEPRPVPVVSLALLGAGVVAGGLGAYFGASANGQLSDARVAPRREDALVQFNDAHGSARTANLLFGTAGLAVAGAVVTWFLLPGEARESK